MQSIELVNSELGFSSSLFVITTQVSYFHASAGEQDVDTG